MTDPRTDDRRDRRARSWLAALTVLLGAIVLLAEFAPGATAVLPYSEFRARVVAGRVASVTIGDRMIRGRYRRPTTGAPAPTAARAPLDFEVVRVADPQLVALLGEKGVTFEGAADTRWLSWSLTAGLSLLAALLVGRWLVQRLQGPSGGVLSFGKSRGKVAGEKDVTVRFDDVAGVDEAKRELLEVVEFLRDAERFKRVGARIPRGVLLVGPPGTGKTLLAKAVAGEAGVPFISLSGSEFVEMFVGVGAARVRDLFEGAQAQAPCIVFIDELDALGRTRGGSAMGSNEEREQTLNQLLVEMDGFATNNGVIVLAATNRPEILDAALLRPGRFDRQVLVDRPDRSGRLAILRVHSRTVSLAPDVDMETLAAETTGYAGADLANLINEGALLAARRGASAATGADLQEAMERVAAGLERRSRVLTPDERRRVAYHELGHALVGEVLGGASRVTKVSIVPRGLGALGYTLKRPTEDRYLLTESELRAQLASLLGGRVAEALFLGEVSTGAASDLSQATEMARAMVVEFGMSEKIGAISLGRGRQIGDWGMMSEHGGSEHGGDLADLVDSEIRLLVSSAEAVARKVLEDRGAAVHSIAATLLEREHLDGAELRAMLETAMRGDAEKT
ncbi:MAG: ATP-dependent metallopeptidase FtsH/Yme1/Tma family protein [Myxococcaceae bacterium]|nr:ATP-dependent metallopeptidase FtsH/Yme1/Tma family protein [Myxococcaceae bacterium]